MNCSSGSEDSVCGPFGAKSTILPLLLVKCEEDMASHLISLGVSSKRGRRSISTLSESNLILNRASLRSWRYCKRPRNKVLATEPTSERRSREENEERDSEIPPENLGFLNVPHTSVRGKRIGREKYTRQSNVR